MNPVLRLLRGLLGLVFRLALIAAGLVFMVSLLLAMLVMLVLGLLAALLTGRKPALSMHWSRYRRWQTRAPWPRRTPHQTPPHDPADVLDVQAREVPPTPPHLPKP